LKRVRSEPRAEQPAPDGGRLVWYSWIPDLVAALPTAVMVDRTYGRRSVGRYLAGLSMAALIRHAFLRWLMLRTGPEATSPGDPLTLARLTSANVIAGLVVSGAQDRPGPAGKLAWGLVFFGATALDWLDGPLARRAGATRHGAVLDIEADSWLTLWSAAAATSWGGLPRWVVLPPLVRYLHPLLDLRDGLLPRGSGPGWSRVTGTAQMALMLSALAPIRWRPPRSALVGLAAVVSGSQLAAVLLLLQRQAHRRPANSEEGDDASPR